MLNVLELLREFDKIFPTSKMRHNVTLNGTQLALNLNVGNNSWQSIYFTEEDYVRPIDILVKEIVEDLRKIGYKI